MKYVVLHGDIAATFDTESSTARGFLAAASKAVADACGCDPCHGEDLLSTGGRVLTFTPENMEYSYLPVEFDLETDTWRIPRAMRGAWRTEPMVPHEELVSCVKKHGPGLYKVMTIGGRVVNIVVNDREPIGRQLSMLCGCDAAADVLFVDARFGTCTHFGRPLPTAMLTEFHGRAYDSSWLSDHVLTCDDDGERRLIRDTLRVWTPRGIEVWGADHARAGSWTCERCYNRFSDDMEHVEIEGRTYCEDCAENADTCDDCGCLTMRATHVGGGLYCPDCAERHIDLEPYGHTYAQRFLSMGERDSGRGLYLGVELETVADNAEDWARCVRNQVQEVTGNRDDCSCKEDSSLDYGGVEIVTQPATPEWHLLAGFWDGVRDEAGGFGAESETTDCCGLHVHVNRDFFGETDGERRPALVTMKRLLERFCEEFAEMSRREDFGWCRMDSDEDLGLYPEDCPRRKRRESWDKRRSDHNHALNYANSATVELRIFRGTLDEGDFDATVECVAALALISRALGRSGGMVESWTWGDLRTEMLCALDAEGIPSEELATYMDGMGL